ncbi:MAG: hypothetical protein NTV09_00215 [Bacteroidetes bacterium]|nr:hypothetical protein [Bacteroidota bacterium]
MKIKNLLSVCLVLFAILGLTRDVNAQTTLAAGDVALVGINSANPDKFSVVLLKDIVTNTVINFTDNGFTGTNTTGRAGEGFLTYTAPSNQAAGTILSWTNGVGGTGWSGSAPTNFSFNGSGDQLFIFQGITANWATQSGITLIYGINYGVALSGTSASANTLQPSTSILPATAWMNLPSTSNANGYFANGTSSTSTVTVSGTATNLLGLFVDPNKWFASSSTAATFPTFNITVTSCSAPTITSVTSNSPICNGATLNLNVAATGTAPLTYAWTGTGTFSSTTVANPSVTSGAATGTYSVTVTNACGNSSSGTSVTVNSNVTPSVSIAANPGVSICTGTNVTFTATPVNGGTPSYQWKLNGGDVGSNNNTYSNNSLSDNDVVTCDMTSNAACASPTTATSNSLTMVVTASVTPSVSISANPGIVICAGTNVTFTATPTNGGTPSYQWKLNGGNVGTNSNTYSDNTLVNGDLVTCLITSTATCASPASATSNTLTMTVNANVTPSVSIAAAPGNVICTGTNVTITATPSNGGTSPNYEFFLNSVSVQSGSSNTYSNNSLADNDAITCTLTSNASCLTASTANSNTITISVTGTVTPSVSIASGSGTTICNGTNVTFTATSVNGGSTPSYQWKLNGNNAGTNSNTYSNNTLADQDVVSCVMTSSNSCASPTIATSNNLTITVTPAVTPSVTIASAPGNVICAGTSVTFTATPVNGGTPSYQWTKNGTNVGTNSPTYTNAALVNNDAIVCTMTSNANCATSPTAVSNAETMTVNALPVPSISGTLSFCSSSSTTLDAGSGYATYSWSTGESTQTISVNTAATFSVTVSNGTCSGTSAAVTTTILNAPAQPGAFTAGSANVTIGQTGVVYTVPNVASVTYAWSYNGTGATINGSSNSVTVDFSSIATSGTLSVTATNSCGTSAARTIAITVVSQFTAGSVVVLQLGAGNRTLANTGNPLFLKEFQTDGTPGFSKMIDSSGTNALIKSGSASSEGGLSLSSDGLKLVIDGYAAALPNATALAGSTSASINRAIGTVNSSGAFTRNFASTTFFNANNIRWATSDGTNFWGVGANDGVDYFGPSAAAIIANSKTNLRAVKIFNNQLYISGASATGTPANTGVFKVGNGFPTSGTNTLTSLFNNANTTTSGFYMNSTATVCYVATSTGIQKWTLSGTWSLSSTLQSTISFFDLVVDFSGANPVLYATTNEATNRLVKITDDGSVNLTALASAGTNTAFRGIAFAPSSCTSPAITQVTSNSPVCAGSPLNLSVTATGTSPLAYSWSGPNGFNSTTQNPSISNATTAASGTYNVTVTNACGTSSSSTSVTVNSLPTASIAPNGPTAFCSGGSVTLSASAGNSWLWSIGATTQDIIVNTSGSFTVVVTSNNCSATSAPASVTVNPNVNPSISISANPGSTICSGTNVTFTAVAVNGGSLPAYQWKLNGNNVGAGIDTYSNSLLADGDIVTCDLISNATCATPATASSNVITINVTTSVTPAVSIAPDAGTTICNGTNVTFTATPVNGGTTPSYQWKLNGNNVGSNSATYSNNSLADQDIVISVMTSSNSCASPTTATSNNLTITVNSNVTPAVSISAAPGNTICSGTNVTFTAIPVNGGTPSYQWTKNGNNVGTNNATYSSAVLSNNDVIVCTMTSTLNCVTSSTAVSNTITMTVNALPVTTIIGALTFCTGGSTTLDAGSGYLAYVWSNAETTQTISVTSAGTYSVTVFNGTCSGTSAPVTVTELSVPVQPANFTTSSTFVSIGQTGVVYTVPNDVAATSYSWNYSGNGATINSGSTNSVTIDFSAAATAGTLSVTANNSCGSSAVRTMSVTINPSSFTSGNLVVLQTTGSVSKASSPVKLKEFTTTGTPAATVAIPSTGATPFQSAGVFGGSEGFITTSTNGQYLVLAGYGTAGTFGDVTGTTAATVPRVVGSVTPSGAYTQFASSNTFYNLNDIRSAVSDGINFWAAGASVNNVDGIDYYGPGAQAGLATGTASPKGYAMRIFNGEIYYSTQKAGPSNTASQLGIFKLGTGLPVSGTVTVSQIINTGTIVPEDFSFNPSLDVCYIAINLNTAAGGIQKWTKSGAVWSLAYTLGTGITNTGAYGLVVNYSGANPVLYATTFDATGNRVIKITDTGSGSSASTIVAAATGVYYKGITFAPVASGTPTVNISLSTNTGSEAATTAVTVTVTASSPVTGNQTVALAVSGTGITAGDYNLSNTTITIPGGATTGSVTFTIVDDAAIEGNETATLTISSPSSGILLGAITSQNLLITDNDADNPPTIAMNVSTTSDFIDGGVVVAPASLYGLSGVITDITDPAATLGVDFVVGDIETAAASLIVTATSSNIAVVPNANLIVSGTGAIRNVKIIPVGIGYSNITVNVNDGINNTTYVIAFAASGSAPDIDLANTFWHTGMSDGSDGVPIDYNYYISGDDELDILNVYSRKASGLPLVSYNYSSNLALPDPGHPEVDVEAGTKSKTTSGKMYWTGSMSNGKFPYDNKPNRDRLFATTVSGTGAATNFAFSGYVNIRTALLAWGDANGYDFTASASAGINSKGIAGFSLEGMVFGPDSTTLFLALRAPLVPLTLRHNALIAPILNFESWFNNGSPAGNPTFGAPIELDLDFRGIRDIIQLSNKTYIIVAGSPVDDGGVNNLYKWTGYASDAPIAITNSAGGILNIEGLMQVNDTTTGQLSLTKLQIISDGGAVNLYNDSNQAKDFGDLKLRKFRSDVITGLDLDICSGFAASITPGGSTNICLGNSVTLAATAGVNNTYLWSTGATTSSISAGSFQSYSVTITGSTNGCSATSTPVSVTNALPSDFNGDHITDNIDFLLLLGLFNQNCNGCAADLDHDGLVNNVDFLILLGQFNHTCP